MLIRRILFLVLFIPFLAKAQENCDCKTNLDSVVQHIKVNYPGFQWKPTNSGEFTNHLLDYEKLARQSTSSKNCQEIINGFLRWFSDGHVGVAYSGDVFKPKKIRPQNTPRWKNLTEEIARKYLDSLAPKDSFSGIWEAYESFYKALICKSEDGTGYRAYLISTINKNWEPGEVKMEFFPDKKGKLICTFYASDHSPEHPKFKLVNNILEINKITVWSKVYPVPAHPNSVESFVSAKYKWTQEFRPWNEEVFYIQLQNITSGVKPLIDSLIKANHRQIVSSKTLILDLRDNEGGDFTVFNGLWPYILDKPAVLYGTTYHCTRANTMAYARQVEEIKGQIEPEFIEFAKEMKEHEGELWKIPNDTLYPEPFDSKLKEIILLVNEKCKSSTEDFILAAKAGSKVIVAGTKTGGVADFEETVDVPLPCNSLTLFHPIGVSNRLPAFPLDGIGIQPDLPLTSGSMAWQPWVKEVLRKRPKK